jgi:hypothetical protein
VRRRLIAVATAVLTTVLIGGVAVQPAAAADPVPTTVTLPLFGVPLTIDITTGPGGALTDVSVDPADNTVATQLRPHKVVFHSANAADPTADPAKVVVRSKHGGQSVSARAGSLADVSGDGSWSGDVFGDGNASSVTFTIGGTDAAPDITGTTATPAAGITAEVGTVEHSTGDDDESSASARVSVTFTTAAGDQSRVLTIKVKVETDDDGDDGDSSAKLSISLGRIKGVAIDAAAAAGPHTWTGLLCDNSTATIDYTVALDGSVSGVAATPDTATVKTDGGKIDVRFSHNERVRIKVREQDGLIKISVDERIRCHSDDPTTNVSTSTHGDDHQGDDESHDDGHDGHSDDGD